MFPSFNTSHTAIYFKCKMENFKIYIIYATTKDSTVDRLYYLRRTNGKCIA